MQVNPADVRFTQDSIRAYFQSPYDHFSIREAVRRISKNEMSPSNFPRIRVISRDGCLWSLDNRRLWVFRLARCSRISVSLVTKMHPRLEVVLSDCSMHQEMIGADYFPRVRGIRDSGFDLKFQQPCSVKQTRAKPWEFRANDAVQVKQESICNWANWQVKKGLAESHATTPKVFQDPEQDQAIHGIRHYGFDLKLQPGPSSVRQNRFGPWDFSANIDAAQVKDSICNWQVNQGLTKKDATRPLLSQVHDHAKAEKFVERTFGNSTSIQEPNNPTVIQSFMLQFFGYFKSCFLPE